MTANEQAEPAFDGSPRAPQPRLLINVLTAHDTCVVHVTGELDVATANQLVAAATAGQHPSMVIDLGGVTFMDCGGYGSIIASRRTIERDGRSLTIVGQTGQPARLFNWIAEFEKCPLAPARNRRRASPQHVSGRATTTHVAVCRSETSRLL